MSQYNEGKKAFTASGAIARFATVKLTSGSGTAVEVAGSNEASIGFAEALAASGETLTVKLKNTGGTYKALASGAFSAGATLYQMAAGKVDDVSGGTARFVALEAAAADGDVVEVLPITAY